MKNVKKRNHRKQKGQKLRNPEQEAVQNTAEKISRKTSEDRYSMSFLRNPEIGHNLMIWILLAAAFCAFSACLDIRFGLAAAVFSVGMIAVFLRMTCRRYELLADMSLEIDRILHGSSHFDLSCFSEGELAILSSEVYKMTVRLREQADTLKRDKVYLADSLADISHQIRTPLTSMNLIANFLSEEDLNRERRLQLARDLCRQLARIDWLITALLKISKLDAGAVQMAKAPVSVLELVNKSAEMVAIPMELRNQKLMIQGEEGVFPGDLSWCVEAVGNILKNCMEHTPSGGTVSVTMQDNSLFTEIVIRDNGKGFDREDIPHLFERFYRGKNAGENSFGIGLALSRMIIQKQNGTIRAGNAEDGGAEFVIRFYKTTI